MTLRSLGLSNVHAEPNSILFTGEAGIDLPQSGTSVDDARIKAQLPHQTFGPIQVLDGDVFECRSLCARADILCQELLVIVGQAEPVELIDHPTNTQYRANSTP